jgi:cell division protein FtsQ
MFKLNPFGRRKGAAKQPVRKQASRKQQKENFKLNINRRYVAIAVVVCALAMVIAVLPREQWLPIEKIRITGEFRQLDTDKLQQQLKPYLGAGFFSVDIEQIQEQVSQQPWIEEVSVRRLWPSKIVVSVIEKQAFARWDDSHLLSTRAEIFAADSKAFSDLPMVHGYAGQTAELLQQFLELKQQFGEYGIQLSALTEDSKGSLSLLLDDHLKVNFGTEETRQKIDKMLMVYQMQIKPKTELIKYIDFRYSNGFAIAWKKDKQQQLSDMKRGNKNV